MLTQRRAAPANGQPEGDPVDPADRLTAAAHTPGDAVALCDALIHELEPDPVFNDGRDVAAVRAIRAVLLKYAR